MPTNREVHSNGDLVDDWACDYDPINDCCQSNGSIESIWEYEGRKYHLFLDFGDQSPYHPDKEAELMPEQTTYIRDIVVADESGNNVDLELHKSPTGGYFAIDTSFIDQVSEVVWDPFADEPTQVNLEDTE